MRCFQTLATEKCLFSQAQLFSFGTRRKAHLPVGCWWREKFSCLASFRSLFLTPGKSFKSVENIAKTSLLSECLSKFNQVFFLDLRKRITDTSYDGQNQTVKLSWPGWGSSPWPFGWRSDASLNHWATETLHLNHHSQFYYNVPAESIPVVQLSRCSDPRMGMADRVKYSLNFSSLQGVVQGQVSTGLPREKAKIERG